MDLLNDTYEDIEKENARVMTYSEKDFIYRDKVKSSWEWKGVRWADALNEFLMAMHKTIQKKYHLVNALRDSLNGASPATQKLISTKVLPSFVDLVDNYYQVVRLLQEVNDFKKYSDFKENVVDKLRLKLDSLENKEQILQRILGSSWK